MEFKTDAQKTCYERIVSMMVELFGEFVEVRTDTPMILVTVGSALARTGIFPWGKHDAAVRTRSYVVADAKITPELMRYLLGENARMNFGAFGIDDDDVILFEHTILGSQCDKEELKASVMAVVMVADQYDDEIVAQWGGRRALDRVE
ncbi:MAG: YbjN domain-containing protein [Blastocatellia bacterium]|nr:YbjN domain-containing protein [Blastocatellia bacterium]